jgi:hypothetical protein
VHLVALDDEHVDVGQDVNQHLVVLVASGNCWVVPCTRSCWPSTSGGHPSQWDGSEVWRVHPVVLAVHQWWTAWI